MSLLRSIPRKVTSLLASAVIAFSVGAGLGNPAAAAGSEVQPVIEWTQEFGDNSMGKSVSPTSDGGYITAGEITELDESGYYPTWVSKAYIVKTNALGQVEWEQKAVYGDSETNSASKAVQTRDGGYIVIGSTDIARMSSVFLIKLSPQGKVEWKVAYEGGQHQYGNAVVEASDGGFLATGYASGWAGASGADAYILKTDAQGHKTWLKTYHFDESQSLSDIIPAEDGGYVAVGSVNVDPYFSGPGDYSVALKINDQGEKVWTKYYKNGDQSRATSVIASGDDGYIIAERLNDVAQNQTRLFKTDLKGEVIWGKTYDFAPIESLNQVVSTGQGYALIGGTYEGAGSARQLKHEVQLVDGNGEAGSKFIFGSDLNGVGHGTYTPDGGFVITGTLGDAEKSKTQLIKIKAKKNNNLTRLAFERSEEQVKAGETAAVKVIGQYGDGSTSELTNGVAYTSQDPSIATVNAEGKITGVKAGATSITAAYEGHEAVLALTVTAAEGPVIGTGEFYLESDEYSLSAGTMIDTAAYFKDTEGKVHNVTQDCEFKSENPEIAEFDAEGNIIGHRAGTTRITATYNGKSYTAAVQVVRAFVPAQDHPANEQLAD